MAAILDLTDDTLGLLDDAFALLLTHCLPSLGNAVYAAARADVPAPGFDTRRRHDALEVRGIIQLAPLERIGERRRGRRRRRRRDNRRAEHRAARNIARAGVNDDRHDDLRLIPHHRAQQLQAAARGIGKIMASTRMLNQFLAGAASNTL